MVDENLRIAVGQPLCPHKGLHRPDHPAGRGLQAHLQLIHVGLPQLQAEAGLIGPYRQLRIRRLPLSHLAGGVAVARPLVARPHHDGGAPVARCPVQVGLQQAEAVVGAVGISETQIHRQGHPPLLPPADRIVQGAHQLRGPGKGSLPPAPQLHRQDGALVGDSPVASPLAAAAPGCDPRHRSPVAAHIHRGHQPPSLLLPGGQSLIDLLLRVDLTLALIPQLPDAGGSVLVAEIRVSVVDAGVDHRHQHPAAGESLPALLEDCDAGSRPASVRLEIQPVGLLHILDLGQAGHVGDQPLRRGENGIAPQEFLHPDPRLAQAVDLPVIAHNQLPLLLRPQISGSQGRGFLPLLLPGVQGQVQDIFQLLTVQKAPPPFFLPYEKGRRSHAFRP